MKFYGIFVSFLLLAHHSFAQGGQGMQDSGAVPVLRDTTQADTSEYFGDTTITKNVFENSGDSVRKWRRAPQFAYMAYIDSLLRKRKGSLRIDTVSITRDQGSHKSHTTPSEETAPMFLNSLAVKIFFWTLAVIFMVFILYRLLFKGGLFERNIRVKEDEAGPAEPGTLNEYDTYNNLIQIAEEHDDYTLATRYLYLQSLKKLSDRELVFFSPDKTNSAYVQELSGKACQSEFAHLTLNYEYIWYGKFSISRDRYFQLKNNFYLFNKQI